MSLIDILILAIALSVDAAVVSFSYGLIIKKKRLQNASKLAFSTGFGQFIMPIIGWLGTSTVSNYLQHFDHWISFFVFLLLGLNIINEALHPQENQLSEKQLHIKYLCIIGLATSIDACAAGVTLYFMQTPIFTASVIIGVITFAASLSEPIVLAQSLLGWRQAFETFQLVLNQGPQDARERAGSH